MGVRSQITFTRIQSLTFIEIALKYSDIVGLERSIDAAYHIASRRLFDIFFEKYGLLDHLQALKNYLLLGHGDFIDQLMDTLS